MKNEENIRKYGYPPFYENGEMYMEDNGLTKKMPDNWWVRLDERTLHILQKLEELTKHQSEANGYIRDNMKRSITNKSTQKYTWIAICILASAIVCLFKLWLTGSIW